MSTKYYKASHAKDATKTAQVKNLLGDTDNMRHTLMFLMDLNDIEPLTKGNWKISVMNYDCSKTYQKTVNWKNIPFNASAGALFSVIDNRPS